MYQKHFGLSRRPFSLVASSRGCVLLPSLKAEWLRCCDAVEEYRCPVLIVGPSGCGKSTLLALLERRFADSEKTVRLDCATIATREELIQILLFELGLPHASSDAGHLRLSLIDFLKTSEDCHEGLVLLFDEAHSLSPQILEELRMMTNLIVDGKPRIRLVLAGAQGLEESLARMDSFNQRISVRCHPSPLDLNETILFVLAQMKMCGRDGREVFTPSSLEKTWQLTGGVPRVISQVCDNALRLACEWNLNQIVPDTVEAAWHDLMRIPKHVESDPCAGVEHDWTEAPGTENTHAVEFGSLRDEDSAADSSSEEATPSPAAETNALVANESPTAFESPVEGTDANFGNWEIEESWAENATGDPYEDFDLDYADGWTDSEPGTSADEEASYDVDSTLNTLLRQLDDLDHPSSKTESDESPESSATGDTRRPSAVQVFRPGKPSRYEHAEPTTTASSGIEETSSCPSNQPPCDESQSGTSQQTRPPESFAYASDNDLFGDGFADERTIAETASTFTAQCNRTSASLLVSDMNDLSGKSVSASGVTTRDVIVETPSLGPQSDQRGDTTTEADSGKAARNDDRDMIHWQTTAEPDLTSQQSNAVEGERRGVDEPTKSPASASQAIRMDYADLFQQLRGNSESNPS